MKDLTLVILTHNRADLVFETVNSVLNQSCHDFKFVISDNSSNTQTLDAFKSKGLYDKVIYRTRAKGSSSFDHFNLVLSEIDTQYFILFHDDDIMMPDYIETMYDAINGTPYAAVGCNCYEMNNSLITKTMMLKSHKDIVIASVDDLVHQYCVQSIVPYPSYIYSKRLCASLTYKTTAGKYSDVLWLMNLISVGPHLWIHSPHMYYRWHLSQDSTINDYASQIHLTDFYYKSSSKNKSILKDIRGMKVFFAIVNEKFKVMHNRSLNKKITLYIFLHGRKKDALSILYHYLKKS